VRITNRTAAPINVRLSVRLAAEALADKAAELYDYPLAANDSVEVTVVAKATDVLTGRASAVSTSWVVKGVKLT
jgi:hypothetical protein